MVSTARVAAKAIWRCIICSTEASDKPPRHCPTCGTPAARWRLVVNRSPQAPPPPAAPAAEEIPPETVNIPEEEVVVS